MKGGRRWKEKSRDGGGKEGTEEERKRREEEQRREKREGRGKGGKGSPKQSQTIISLVNWSTGHILKGSWGFSCSSDKTRWG